MAYQKCKVCGRNCEKDELCHDCFRKTPEGRVYTNNYGKIYRSRPKVKAKIKEHAKTYSQKPEIKEKRRNYNHVHQNLPQVKERRRKYQLKYYHENSEKILDRKKERTTSLTIAREYQKLMKLLGENGTLPQAKMLRLYALGDILGRDLEEWRPKEQKEKDINLIEGD